MMISSSSSFDQNRPWIVFCDNLIRIYRPFDIFIIHEDSSGRGGHLPSEDEEEEEQTWFAYELCF